MTQARLVRSPNSATGGSLKLKVGACYRVSHDTGHLENLAKSQALYKHELDT